MKQKTLAYVLIALLAVSLFLIIGRLLVIAPIEEKILVQEKQAETLKVQLTTLNTQIEKAKKNTTDTPQTLLLLPSGSEHEILQAIVSAASTTGFLIETLTLAPTFERKPKAEDAVESKAPSTAPGGALPQVDENGVAIGISTEEDESGPTVEVVPVRVQGKGALKEWGLFLRQIRQTLPLFGVRELTLDYSTPSPTGSFELVVPLKSAMISPPATSQSLTGGK